MASSDGLSLPEELLFMIRVWPSLVLVGILAQVVRIPALGASCGICPQGNESGAAGSFPESLLAAQTYPIGNAALTYASFSVVGTTGQDDQREFLVSLGLVSDRGNQVAYSHYNTHLMLQYRNSELII
jgi:hypothetical protein